MPLISRPEPATPLRRAPVLLLGACLFLSACAVGIETGGQPPRPDPSVFHARLTQDGMSGQYDPAGFSAADMQRALGEICGNRRLQSYDEAPDGALMRFRADCFGGTTVRMGTIWFRRWGDNVRIEVPGFIDRRRYESRTWSIRL